jgi:hypothetical protein
VPQILKPVREYLRNTAKHTKKPPSNSNNTAALVPKPTIDLPFKGEVKKKQGQEKEEKGVTFCLPLILLKSQQGTKHRSRTAAVIIVGQITTPHNF